MKYNTNLMILATLINGDKYGLQIIKDIKEIGNVNLDLKLPSLYNSIKRMESYGYIQSYWENSEIGGKRRYCSITEKGKKHLQSQMQSLDENEKNILLRLQDSFTSINNNSYIEQNDITNSNDKITIQQNLFNEVDLGQNNSNIVEETTTTNSLYNQATTSNNEKNYNDNLNYKAIFGDMVYEQNNNSNENSNKNYNYEQTTSQLEIVKEDYIKNDIPHYGIVDDRQNIDYKYKVNVTLKGSNINVLNKTSNNEQTNNLKSQNSIIENKNYFEKESDNFIKQDLTNSSGQSINSRMVECLKYFKTIGINSRIYDCNTNIGIKEFVEQKDYYKNKLDSYKYCVSFFNTFLVSIIIYLLLGLFDCITFPVQITYFIILGILIVSSLANLIAFFALKSNIIEYKKRNRKANLMPLFTTIIAIVVIIAISFICGMTFSNFKEFIGFFCIPLIYLAFTYCVYLIQSICYKKKKFFVNK